MDISVTTLWAGNLTSDISAEDIREAFYPFGRICNIHVVAASKCAFIEYASRAEAEHAATQLFKSLIVKGQPLSLNWAKPRAQFGIEKNTSSTSFASCSVSALPPPPGMENACRSEYMLPGMPAPRDAGKDGSVPNKRRRTDCENISFSPYPSMNPSRMGSKL